MRHIAAAAFVLGFGALPALADPSPASVDFDAELRRLDGEQQRMTAELDDMRPRLDLTHRRILARGRAYYRLTRAGLLPAGGGFDAIVDHAAHVERTRRALERDMASEATLTKRITEVEQRMSRIRNERAPVALQHDALLHARQALQEADERRAAFARAFETSVRPDSVAVYGADMGPSSDPTSGFRALRGRLPFPVAGRAEIERVNRSGGPAVLLLAPMGTAVRSVAAGRVAFADRQDAYGLTVIVDHGDRYYSLYGSLAAADVHVGDTIAAGARLGSVGSADGSKPRLYFELRHNAATLDPGPWLGL